MRLDCLASEAGYRVAGVGKCELRQGDVCWCVGCLISLGITRRVGRWILCARILNIGPGDGGKNRSESWFERARHDLRVVAVTNGVVDRRAGRERPANDFEARYAGTAQEHAADDPFAIDAEAKRTAKFPLGEQRILQVGNQHVDRRQFVAFDAYALRRSQAFELPGRDAVEDIDFPGQEGDDCRFVVELRLFDDRLRSGRRGCVGRPQREYNLRCRKVGNREWSSADDWRNHLQQCFWAYVRLFQLQNNRRAAIQRYAIYQCGKAAMKDRAAR